MADRLAVSNPGPSIVKNGNLSLGRKKVVSSCLAHAIWGLSDTRRNELPAIHICSWHDSTRELVSIKENDGIQRNLKALEPGLP